MKVLYVTTVGITMMFFKSFIKKLIDEGHSVDIATNDTGSQVDDFYREIGCNIITLSCSRSPFKKGNFKAIKEIRALVKTNKYDIVHCHTPIAAMCTRLACRKFRKKGLKVVYTAHGFHFYKGAPLKNWLIYYPIEKLCSYFTDVLITINREDYDLAKRKLKAKKIEYVPGVGIDIDRFMGVEVDKETKRREIGVPKDATMILSVGELNENKNHKVVINAISKIENESIYYVIAGEGNLRGSLINLAKQLGVDNKVILLGYRRDVVELCKSADMYIHPSYREGLPVALMEAVACGIPCMASNIRGCNDLLSNSLFAPNDVNAIIDIIKSGGEKAYIDSRFSKDSVNAKLMEIYGG